MRFSEHIENIAAALAEVQAEIKNPIKDQINRGVMGAPKYANLEDTLQDYVRPVLTRHGMSVFQSVKSENGQVGVCTVLLHKSGEFIEGDYVFCDVNIPLSKDGKKILTDGQATGVVITYLRRYSLNSALGINGDKDTDGSFTEQPIPEPKNAPVEPQMTVEQALEVKINGVTVKEIYKDKEMKERIAQIYEASTPEQRTALNIVNEYIKESRTKK